MLRILQATLLPLSATWALSTTSAQDQDQDPGDQLRAVLTEVQAFSGIESTVSNGVAELTGTVATTEARARAADLASRIEGVLFVENLLELPPPPADPDDDTDDAAGASSAADRELEDRLRSVFARVEELREIDVDVAAGVVRLSGEVLAGSAREQATDYVRAQDGVAFVVDEIEESKALDDRLLPSLDRLLAEARGAIASLPLLAIALLVVIAAWWLAGRLAQATVLYRRLSDSVLVQGLASQLAKAIVIVFGVFIALELLDATALVGAVLGSVGVVSLALGLAFRDIAENYLASIILSVRRPFRTKDVVEIDGVTGRVIRMTTRETVLMTFDGNHVLFPNSMVFKSRIVNVTRADKRRFMVNVGFGTDVDLIRAIELGIGKLREIPAVLETPAPSAWIEELGDSNVVVKFVGWIDQRESDFNRVQSEAIRLVKETMDDEGLDMPEPIYRVNLVDESAGAAAQGSPGGTPEPKVRRSAAPLASEDLAADDPIEREIDAELAGSNEEDLLGSKEPPQVTSSR